MRISKWSLVLLLSTVPAFSQSYEITDHWKIGGTGGWDYLVSDDQAHRLYVTHGSEVNVLDTESGRLVGKVDGLTRVHGVALNTDGQEGYISDGGADTVVVFDRANFTVKAKIKAGKNPDSILFEPHTKMVWAFNGASNDVTVIDTSGQSHPITLKLPGRPEFARSDSKDYIFVNLEDKNAVAKIAIARPAVVAVWPLHDCEAPSGMALDNRGKRLFSVCDGQKMVVLDYSTGKQLGTAKIGDSPDAAAFDPRRSIVFSSNGGGTLSIIDASKPSLPTLQTLETARGARTMAFNASTGAVYLVSAKFGATPQKTAQNPRPRPAIVPDSFEVLVVKPASK